MRPGIATARDRTVRLLTLERLLERHAASLPSGTFGSLREALAAEPGRGGAAHHTSAEIIDSLTTLRTCRRRFAAWAVEGTGPGGVADDFAAIAPGLRRVYRQGRSRMKEAYGWGPRPPSTAGASRPSTCATRSKRWSRPGRKSWGAWPRRPTAWPRPWGTSTTAPCWERRWPPPRTCCPTMRSAACWPPWSPRSRIACAARPTLWANASTPSRRPPSSPAWRLLGGLAPLSGAVRPVGRRAGTLAPRSP